jgi:hypothetical protein
MDRDGMWQLFQADTERITALDQVAIAIRGWAIPPTSALAAFGMAYSDRSLVLAAVVVPLLFGLLDVRYRTTQLLHAARVDLLQESLAPDYPLRPMKSRMTGLTGFLSRGPTSSAVSFHAALAAVVLLIALVM